MDLARSLAAGLTGAATLTLVHQTAKPLIPHAPRVDAIGRRAVVKTFRAAGRRPPNQRAQQNIALAGDLISNALYYSLVEIGHPRNRLTRGAILGVLAGLGAAFLPRRIGLGRQPQQRAPITHLLTIAWYALGGLAAAAAAQALDSGRDH